MYMSAHNLLEPSMSPEWNDRESNQRPFDYESDIGDAL